MATENEKGWSRFGREAVRENVKNHSVLFLVWLPCPYWPSAFSLQTGRLVGRRELKPEPVWLCPFTALRGI